MTRSEYIQKRIMPLVRMMEPFVHEEMRDLVKVKVEIWALRLITDLDHLSSTNIDEVSDKDFPYNL